MASQIAVSVCRLGVEADVQGFYNGKIFASSLFAYLVTGTSYTCFRCKLSPRSNAGWQELAKVMLLQKADSNSYSQMAYDGLDVLQCCLLALANQHIIGHYSVPVTRGRLPGGCNNIRRCLM